VQRRTFLAATVTGVGSVIADRLPPASLRLDDESLGSFTNVLGELRLLDVRDGSARVIMPAHWIAARLSRALGNTPPEHSLHHQIAMLVADAAELAGWVSFETGDYPEALHWYERTIRAAVAANDPDLTASATAGRAWVLFLGLGDTGSALAELDRIRLDEVSGQLSALAHACRARVLAVAGKRSKASLRAIDQAAAVAALDGPPWAGWCGTPAQIELEHGLTQVDLGHGEPAYRLLRGALRTVPPRLRRVTGTVHRGLAQAAIQMGEPKQAAAHIVSAHRLLSATGSRQLATLQGVTRELQARYGDVRQVRDLPERLRTDTRYVVCRTSGDGLRIHLRTCRYAGRGGARPWSAGERLEPADLATSSAVNGYELCERCLE
jgi:hypothetical protein